MLITPTIDRLLGLGLGGMARALLDQQGHPDHAALTFEERLGLLVDREVQDRENRRLARHLKSARLRSDAVIEDLDLRSPRGLDRATVLSLADAHWVTAHRNVLVTGPTGVGKTFLACALAHSAIRRGHTALYLRIPRLLDELVLARADGRLPRLMASWARIDVLVLDDLGSSRCHLRGRPTCWRSSRTARAPAPRSSPASCRWATGTRPWAIPRSPTPSSTVWSTAPTGWSSGATPDGARRRHGHRIGRPTGIRPPQKPQGGRDGTGEAWMTSGTVPIGRPRDRGRLPDHQREEVTHRG